MGLHGGVVHAHQSKLSDFWFDMLR